MSEEIEKKTENVTNVTQETSEKSDFCDGITKSLKYEIKLSDLEKRIIAQKRLFLENYDKSLANVTLSAKASGIERVTFYRWKETDPIFRSKAEKILRERSSQVEDRLLRAIMKNEPWSISLYLNRIHPNYNPKIKVEQISPERTYKDVMDEVEKKIEDKKKKNRTVNKQKTLTYHVVIK